MAGGCWLAKWNSSQVLFFRSSFLFRVQLICIGPSFLRTNDMLIFYGSVNDSFDIPEKGHTFMTIPPTTANSGIYMINTTNGVVVEGTQVY